MTGDVNLTHIRAVMHLRGTKSAVARVVSLPDLDRAEAQLAAVEAVIQAARDVADTSPALMSDTPFAHALNRLHERLAALEDGQ